MNQIRDVASERGYRERLSPGNYAGGDREREQRREQPKPDRPQLGQCLEIEAVGVENRQVGRPRTQPAALEASCTGAEPRMLLVVPPGDVPVLRPAVSREAEEALAPGRFDRGRRM